LFKVTGLGSLKGSKYINRKLLCNTKYSKEGKITYVGVYV